MVPFCGDCGNMLPVLSTGSYCTTCTDRREMPIDVEEAQELVNKYNKLVQKHRPADYRRHVRGIIITRLLLSGLDVKLYEAFEEYKMLDLIPTMKDSTVKRSKSPWKDKFEFNYENSEIKRLEGKV